MLGVTTNGDPTNQSFHGGLPWSLLEALKQEGLSHRSIDCSRFDSRPQRITGRLKYVLSQGGIRGFQYSRTYQKEICKWLVSESIRLQVDGVISFYPLLTTANRFIKGDAPPTSLYIDATIDQIIYNYGRIEMNKRQIQDAIERQEECLRKSKKIYCRNNWVYDHAMKYYGISESKLQLLPGSGNMHIVRASNDSCLEEDFEGVDSGLRLLFLGKDTRRKNLAEVLDVARIITETGKKCSVHVVGSEYQPEGFDNIEVVVHGYVDPSSEAKRLVRLIKSSHFTCLFSSAEGGPRSNIESYLCGTPVVTHDIGGISSTFIEGSGLMFSPESSSSEKAEAICKLFDDKRRYREHRDLALRVSNKLFDWQETARVLASIQSQ